MQRRDLIETSLSLLGGMGLGAAMMYLFDPESGQDRREHIGRRTGSAVGGTTEALGAALYGLADHARDLGHTVSDRLSHGTERVSDWGSSVGSSTAEGARDLWHRGRRAVGWEREEESAADSVTNMALAAVGCCALGAGLMYLLDPQVGGRRRAMARDKATHYAQGAGEYLGSKSRHLRNRAQGVYHEARSMVQQGATAGSGMLQKGAGMVGLGGGNGGQHSDQGAEDTAGGMDRGASPSSNAANQAGGSPGMTL